MITEEGKFMGQADGLFKEIGCWGDKFHDVPASEAEVAEGKQVLPK
jgi:hypothetical protein